MPKGCFASLQRRKGQGLGVLGGQAAGEWPTSPTLTPTSMQTLKLALALALAGCDSHAAMRKSSARSVCCADAVETPCLTAGIRARNVRAANVVRSSQGQQAVVLGLRTKGVHVRVQARVCARTVPPASRVMTTLVRSPSCVTVMPYTVHATARQGISRASRHSLEWVCRVVD